MSKGRPKKYNTIEELRAIQRKRSKKYYEENKEVVLAKAKMKRRKQRENKENK